MKLFLATTTINVPSLLRAYAQEAAELAAKRAFSFEFVVAGDRKSPLQVAPLLEELQSLYGVKMTYLSPAAQQELLLNNKALKSYLDFDCIQRRNLAGYFAYINAADFIVYIDDDNLMGDHGYFSHHLEAMNLTQGPAISCPSGFYNIMSGATGYHSGDWLFPRGFPFKDRNKKSSSQQKNFMGRICANAGLWTEEPDIDAVSRIAGRPLIDKYSLKNASTVLAPGTWSPINSQNTCFRAEFLPTYYLSSHVGRYDDIFAGYVLQRIAMELDFAVSFGEPVVRQERNEHDLLSDLNLENTGMKVIDYFLEEIRGYSLKGNSIQELLSSLLQEMEGTLLELPKGHFAQNTFKALHTGYSLWQELLLSKHSF